MEGLPILDPCDPAESGMFSKMGRFSSEKYPILLQKDEIINDERKTLRPKDLPYEEAEEPVKPAILLKEPKGYEIIVDQQKLLTRYDPPPKIIKGIPFSKTVNRENHFIYKCNKGLETPGPTRYRPKPVRGHIKLINNYEAEIQSRQQTLKSLHDRNVYPKENNLDDDERYGQVSDHAKELMEDKAKRNIRGVRFSLQDGHVPMLVNMGVESHKSKIQLARELDEETVKANLEPSTSEQDLTQAMRKLCFSQVLVSKKETILFLTLITKYFVKATL